MPATAAISPSPPGTSTTTTRVLNRHHLAASFIPPQSSGRRLTGAVAASAGRRAVASCCKAAKDPSSFSATNHVGDVGQETWDEAVLKCETAVLVEFWAPWCGPCRLMHPVIADLAKAYAGRLSCVRVNTDKNQEVATRYGIRSIPTILIFKDGERKETVIGAIAPTALAATVDRFL